jgi:CheY-like chemotaxis protein
MWSRQCPRPHIACCSWTTTRIRASLSVADESCPDCVILDLGLPRLDGYEVARRLRTRPYGADLVLVALTGWAGKDVRSKAAEAGFDYHLVKPVNWEELERIVESAVRQST